MTRDERAVFASGDTLDLRGVGPGASGTAPAPGTVMRGTYRVLDTLGSGAMGTVLHAVDQALDREVAIKVILRESADPALLATWFRDEARAMARIRHPNVVEIHAFGEHDGRPFIVMEYVPGPNLGDWLDEHGPLPLATAIDIIDQICQGVQAIHDSDAVHYDLKPGNILVGPGQRVLVADFGLASPLHAPPRFAPGEIAGTPAYLAPEIARAEPLDPALLPRIDVYALAVMAFELLTGVPPFRANAAAGLIMMHGYEPAPTASTVRADLPSSFDAPLARALAKHPRERTPSVAELRRELDDAARRGAAVSRPLHIVLADDDPSTLGAMTEILAEEFVGARIDAFPDAAAAVAAARRAPPDVVITDLHMPCGGGLAVTQGLRAEASTRDVPVVVITGQGGASDWQRLRAVGADRFLIKPVEVDTLINAIRSVTAKRRPPA